MTALLLSAFLLFACDPGHEEPAASEAPAGPAAEAPAATPAAAAHGAAASAILGEWEIVLTDEDRRQLEVLRLAFRDPPPTDADFKAAGLTGEEQMMVSLMAAAKARNPDDAKVVEMQQAVKGLEEARLVVTADKMTLVSGAMSKDASYTVKSATDSQITVETIDAQGVPEVTTISLEGADTLVLTDITNAKRTQRFRRQGAAAPAEGGEGSAQAPGSEAPTTGGI